MPKFTDRTGEIGISKQGNPMRIIAYRSSCDIDILFLNTGYIAYNKHYRDFCHGLVSDKSIKRHNDVTDVRKEYAEKMKGKTYSHKLYNLSMTIIDYRNNEDVTIQFTDGEVISSVTMKQIREGKIRHPLYIGTRHKDSYIGETSTNSQGLLMTIISINSLKSLKVRFEDGAERTSSYANFLNGNILNPNIVSSKFRNDEKILNSGLHVRVKEVIDSRHLLIEFDDGTELLVLTYSYVQGTIRKPFSKNDYIGKTFGSWYIKDVEEPYEIAKSKCTAVCLDCNKEYNPVLSPILYGNSLRCRSCSSSKNSLKIWGSRVSHHIGRIINSYRVRRRVDKDNWELECINCGDIVICSTDQVRYGIIDCPCNRGLRYDNRTFQTIKDFRQYLLTKFGVTVSFTSLSNHIKNNSLDRYIDKLKLSAEYGSPNVKPKLGNKLILKSGLVVTVTGFRKNSDIDITFEDGSTMNNIRYSSIKQGNLIHPAFYKKYDKLFSGFRILDFAYRLKNPKDVYYFCKCSKCGVKDILTPSQMLKHNC